MYQTVTSIYFSPTGGTKQSVRAMAEALGGERTEYDVTTDASPAPHRFEPDDFVIFGMPVHCYRRLYGP